MGGEQALGSSDCSRGVHAEKDIDYTLAEGILQREGPAMGPELVDNQDWDRVGGTAWL